MIDLHFIRPYWLLAFIPLLILWILMLRYSKTSEQWRKVCDPHLLPHLLVPPESGKAKAPLLLLLTAWCIAIIALAGPSLHKKSVKFYQKASARIIVVDMSPNMLATDIKPSRLVRAKFKIRDLLQRITEGRVGMVAFSSEGYTVSPLTRDSNTVAAMLQELTPAIMPAVGDNIAAGIKQAIKLLKQGNAKNGSIILITASKPNSAAMTAAKLATKDNIKLEVLGIGTKQGAPLPSTHGFIYDTQGQLVMSKLDIVALQNLARAANGNYVFFKNTNTDILKLLNDSKPINDNASLAKTDDKLSQWQDQGIYLLWLLIPLAALAWRRGWRFT